MNSNKGRISKALLMRLELMATANPHNLELRATFETLQTLKKHDDNMK